MSNVHEGRIQRWAHLGHAAVVDLLPVNQPLNDIVGERRHRRSLMLLSTACMGNSESVLYLCHGRRLWDAEIVVRSIFEGTVKFAYMLESPATLEERCREYSEILPAISKLRWHDKSVEALAALGDDGSLAKQPYRDMVLPAEELERLRKEYPRQLRHEVERRWGFTNLVTAISRPGGAFGPVGRSALHSYMVSSHLTHMSYEGVDMPPERDTRAAERREAVEAAHAARLISDCFELAFFRAGAIRRHLGRPVDDLFAVRARHEAFLQELGDANDRFSEFEYGSGRNGQDAG